MQLISLIFLHTLILYSILNLSSVKALSGKNVKFAREKEFPFVVSIGLPHKHYYADEKHICTGALISRYHVLTAAHCFHPPTPRVVQVTIGSVDLRHGRAFLSDKWITYSDWAKSSAWSSFSYGLNDIAIIKLREKVNEPSIKPAYLWCGRKANVYGRTVTAVGWGYTDNVESPSQHLKAGSMRIINDRQCKDIVKTIDPRNYLTFPRHLYAHAEPPVLLESGDSGGPLIIGKEFIVGISSGTHPKIDCPPHCSKDVFDKCQVNIYLNVATYQSFIQDNLKRM